MQYNLDQARLFFRDNLPTTKPTNFITKRDLMILDSGKWYVWDNRWVEVNNPNQSQSGTPATVQVGTVTTKTVSPTNQAKVTITDSDPSDSGVTLNFDFEIPQGVPGTGGTGGGGFIPGHIYVGGSADDTVAIQNMVNLQATDKKPIYVCGTINTSSIVLPKLSFRPTIIGWGAKWTMKPGVGTLLKKDKPVDNTEANIMTSTKYIVKGIDFFGSTDQTCFEPGPSYNSEVAHCSFNGFKTGIHNRFGLNFTIYKNEFFCLNGDIADMGDWTGATNSNSQSNNTHRLFNRYRCMTGAETASSSYAASGCIYEGNIFEWDKAKKVINFDFKMSTVVKDLTIRQCHFETVNGNLGANSGEAYIWIRSVGNVHISGIFSQYPGCLINASGNPAQLLIEVERIPWCVVPGDGKLFYNGGGTQWVFRNNTTDSINSNLSNKFAGTAVSECGGNGCGNNKYTLEYFGYRSPFGSARMVYETPKPYKLELTVNKNAYDLMHPTLKGLTGGLGYIHTYYFDTDTEAYEFASANPDFIATITENI